MGCYATAYNQSKTLHDRKFRTLRKSDFESVILAMDEGIVNQNHSQNVKTAAKQKSVRRPPEDCYDDYFIAGSKAKKGKPAIRRVIAVAAIGKEAYLDMLHAARASGGAKLIDGSAGNRNSVNFQKRDFKELMEEIGCTDMIPYNCRHTFSTWAVKNGVTPQMLSRMMGHTDIKTADKHYTHLDADDILQAVSKISYTA